MLILSFIILRVTIFSQLVKVSIQFDEVTMFYSFKEVKLPRKLFHKVTIYYEMIKFYVNNPKCITNGIKFWSTNDFSFIRKNYITYFCDKFLRIRIIPDFFWNISYNTYTFIGTANDNQFILTFIFFVFSRFKMFPVLQCVYIFVFDDVFNQYLISVFSRLKSVT